MARPASDLKTDRKPKPRVGDGTPGPGRPKGKQNKNTTLLKDMILQALDKAGGIEYLAAQAEENPGPFMSLVGKVLPTQITGPNDGPIQIATILMERRQRAGIDNAQA